MEFDSNTKQKMRMIIWFKKKKTKLSILHYAWLSVDMNFRAHIILIDTVSNKKDDGPSHTAAALTRKNIFFLVYCNRFL